MERVKEDYYPTEDRCYYEIGRFERVRFTIRSDGQHPLYVEAQVTEDEKGLEISAMCGNTSLKIVPRALHIVEVKVDE